MCLSRRMKTSSMIVLLCLHFSSLSVISSFIRRIMSNTLICPMYSRHYTMLHLIQSYLVRLITELVIFLLIVDQLDEDHYAALTDHLLGVALIPLE